MGNRDWWAEVFKMIAARGGDYGAITAVAHDLGKYPSTARVQLLNAKRKLLAAARR